MAISSPKFMVHLHSGPNQMPPLTGSGAVDARCFIHSNHPLARFLVKDALSSDSRLRSSISHFSNDSKPLDGEKRNILLLDTCSVESWAVCMDKWRLQGGMAIALISPETRTNELELQMLYLGAAGVLTFADNLINELPRAIHAVAEGRLWIRREVLNAYVTRAATVLRKTPACQEALTGRERQIIDLLNQQLSNRSIAQRLGIRERTVKFHISNILRKMNISNRKELQALSRSAVSFCPDWLLHRDVA